MSGFSVDEYVRWEMLWPFVENTLYYREGNGTPLQYSCLENPMDGGAWWAAVHGVAEGWTRLSNFTFTFHFHTMEKEMATHSSTLAWRILWTEELSRLQSRGSQRVGHEWEINFHFTFIYYRKKNSARTLTSTVQTHVVQGSTVHVFSLRVSL